MKEEGEEEERGGGHRGSDVKYMRILEKIYEAGEKRRQAHNTAA